MPKVTFKPEDPYPHTEVKRPKKRLPQEHFHNIPKELMNGLPEVGEDVEITIRGKLVSKSIREEFAEKDNRGSFGIELKAMEAYGANEFSEMSKDDE